MTNTCNASNMATAIQRSIVQTYRTFGLTAFFNLKKYMTTKSLLTSIDESTLYSFAFFSAKGTKDLYVSFSDRWLQSGAKHWTITIVLTAFSFNFKTTGLLLEQKHK